ncbi:MAG: shikimate dehydrogenase [Opitutales bacterium]|nr:shikimate dehydrogenase [Opitutales bacterium]
MRSEDEEIKLDASARPLAGQTLRLDQIRESSFAGLTALAVLGWPIRHSVSPQMHNAALAELARKNERFANWRYYRVEVEPENLKAALELLAEKGFAGLNLTIPHKVLALEHVEIAEDDWNGLASGAVNTLYRFGNGWRGTNTDGIGLLLGLMEAPTYASIRGRDVILVGAGGAARAIGASCLISGCRSLYVGNRSADRLEELLKQLEPLNQTGNLHGFDLKDSLHTPLPSSPVVINATSLGLKPDDPCPLDLAAFEAGTVVFDTTYGKHRSKLVEQAQSYGFAASNGLPMLVNQGAKALALWTGFDEGLPPEVIARMYCAAREALGLS